MPRHMKRFDTADPITGTVTETVNGVEVRADLTRFVSINFQFKVDGAADFVGGEAEIVEVVDGPGDDLDDGLPANRGRWRYLQVNTDVDMAETYEAELEATDADGKKAHWPNRKSANDRIIIDEDLSND